MPYIDSKRYMISSPWLKKILKFSPFKYSKLTLKGKCDFFTMVEEENFEL